MCYNDIVGMLEKINSNSVYTLGMSNCAYPFLFVDFRSMSQVIQPINLL